jgi:hydrophobe/amphiphile efflux-3 (HAE3) family protein
MNKPFVQRLVGTAIRHPWVIILLVAFLTAFLGYFALKIQINADVLDMLPSNHKVMQLTARYGNTRDAGQLLVAVAAKHPGQDLFSPQGLAALQEAIDRISSLECVLGAIHPFNFITFGSDGTKLTPLPMAPEGRVPQSQPELQRFRQRLSDDPLARNMVISGDGTALCAIFPVALQQDYAELTAKVNEVLPSLERYYTVYLAGAPLVVQKTKEALLADVPKFLLLSVAVILLILFLSFRSLRALLLPLTVVVLGTLWTLGTMRLLGFSLTLVSIMAPPLVLTLGSAYSIHVLNQYYREARTGPGDRESIARSVGHINQTILLASLTTVIGFSSLASATLRQIREFGVATSIGIVYCALLALFFLPAVLSLLPTPRPAERDRVLKGYLARFMGRLGGWVLRRRYPIVASVVLIAAAFGVSLRSIHYQTDFMAYFRQKQRLIHDSQELIKRFGGYSNVFLTIEAPEGSDQANYFLDPEVLRKVARFEEALEADPDVSSIFSFTQYLKLMNLRLSGSYTVPDRRAPILLLSRYMRAIIDSPYGRSIEGKPVNEDFTRLTISLRVWNGEKKRHHMEREFKDLIARIEALIDERLDSRPRPVLWGRSLALLYISETLSRDQLYSGLVSIALIFAVTAAGFRSLRLGLLTLIPLATGIMLNFILMVVLNIPFDVVTVMFASVAMGVGIDDSIHLIVRYRRHARLRRGESDPQDILVHTLKSAGRPILIASISLVAGLLVLTFSQFKPIQYFGLLVSLALVTTTAGALIILPAVLSLAPPARGKTPESEEASQELPDSAS